MGRFFPSERIGGPQFVAGLLLLVFLGECLWLMSDESAMLSAGFDGDAAHSDGLALSTQNGMDATPGPFDREHSPLFYWPSSLAVAIVRLSPASPFSLPLTRAPYVLVGLLLGASVWYVSRRLYGNAGGYTALALYCSSPTLVRASVLWFAPPNLPAAWGSFGAVFTAIALAHTLYAPREVVLWNWRRILLLAVSIGVAIGCQYSLVVIVPVLLVFMLYLAPERRGAVLIILAAALTISVVLVWAGYSFRAGPFWAGLTQARWFEVDWRGLGMPKAYPALARELAESGPVAVLLAVAAFLTYLFWRRCRYFGNTAPVIVALLFLVLHLVSPHSQDAVWGLAAVVFLFVFIAGIAADLLETGRGELVRAVVFGLVTANWAWNLVALAGIRRS